MKEFLDGFMKVTGFSRVKADSVWAAYSYQLSDTERRKIEELGYYNGKLEGFKYLRWAKQNPMEDK